MSLDVLVGARLVKPAQQRTASNGNAYALAQVIVPTEGDESLLASCIAFQSAAVAALLALGAGDAVALAGKAKLRTWTGADGALNHGLSVTVDAVLTVYAISKKRAAVQGDEPAPRPARASASRKPVPVPSGEGIGDMDDDLPDGFER